MRIESPGYFTCEYRFQLVAGRHWLLSEVVSWFDPANKSRGAVENVQVNGGGEILAEGDYQSVARNPDVIQAYMGSGRA